jgi:hypothetical protein
MYIQGMRTTITLDDDVAAMIQTLQTREGKSFKQMVNDLLRKGLLSDKGTGESKQQYSTPLLSAGECRFPDLDNVAEVLSVAENEDYR